VADRAPAEADPHAIGSSYETERDGADAALAPRQDLGTGKTRGLGVAGHRVR
jgi:hypothetical protein